MAEDFGKKVEKFGQDVWKKTTDTFGVIGKQSEIASKTHELRDVYAEIGRQFCEKYSSEAETQFPDLCADALSLMQQISDLEAQVLEQRGRKKCVKCGESISKTVAFCPHCGAEQPKEDQTKEQSAPEADRWACPNCGATLDQDDLYCSSCGTRRPS
jgi:RNA polymerase subunit RPABC4/transcription elongation factor Spt4